MKCKDCEYCSRTKPKSYPNLGYCSKFDKQVHFFKGECTQCWSCGGTYDPNSEEVRLGQHFNPDLERRYHMLTSEEQETLIRWDNKDRIATIETPKGRIKTRLDKLGIKPSSNSRIEKEVVTWVYEVPADWIKINPKKQVQKTQKQLESLCLAREFRNKKSS